ncbi:MAG TPA: UvrD-helicase domain-containing protein [Burkholderiaceae bacterium]|nr:UvrD-helicase domain-containing protein [Burkholderiaceae bacterium]HQR68975.1 UvrD-helicase domain-containing protein [Burkholderiaceae bacterium]
MNLLQNLNEQQLAAVTLPSQSALILAGAGSGKTRVLTTRIAWLIQTGQISPQGVLAVTFTNKAAKEMLTRLGAMLPINVRGMWIGTFHGLCNRMLRAHHRDAGLPATFQILDSADQLGAIKRLLKANSIDDERYPPRNLQLFINNAKEAGLRAKEVEVNDDYNRRFVELYSMYDAQCNREGVCDFAELLLRCYELLDRNAILREHYQGRFRHILVDEFQDTNKLQYAWLKQLAGGRNAIFAVGDDDQSIYAFRGANVGNMADFEREFRVQNLIKLEQNYRSFGHILNSANALIANNQRRLGKELWTDAGEGEPVRIFEAQTDGYEAAWLVDEVKGLIAEGHARSEIAVLYRSNAQSRVIEHALFNSAIPYRVYGGLRFFERAEIKHALAYLRLIENPADDTAFLRVVNFPPRGIGARTLEQLADAARAAGASLYAAVGSMTGKAGANLGAFVKLVDSLRFETASLSLAEIVDAVIQRSCLIPHYQAEKEGQERIENLNELVNAAAAFVQEEGYGTDAPGTQAETEAAIPSPLAGFLSHASLEAGENQAEAGQDALQLMTVHAAKGLEFHAVFITGLEEGLFPHENSLTEMDGLEEERRLMYVAITRARRRLYISFAQSRLLHGQTRYGIRSRFLEELPDAAVKWLTPRVAAGGGGRFGQWHDAGVRPTVPDAPPLRSAPSHGLRIGQSVRHARFGEGVVINLEGSGDDARAQVNFGPVGVKWLALAVAKLAPA